MQHEGDEISADFEQQSSLLQLYSGFYLSIPFSLCLPFSPYMYIIKQTFIHFVSFYYLHHACTRIFHPIFYLIVFR